MVEIIKCIFLFLTIVYGFSNTVKVFRKLEINDFQILLMGIGIVGFIYLQWWR